MAKGTRAYWDDIQNSYFDLIQDKTKHKGYNAAVFMPL